MPRIRTVKPETKRVYFIVDGHGHLKIGCSSDPQARLAGLQTATALKLTLLCHRPGGRESERLLHEEFEQDRVFGEWFRISDSLRSFMNDVVHYDWREDMTASEALKDWYDLLTLDHEYDVLYKQNAWAEAAQGG